jgi:two-component system response regulator
MTPRPILLVEDTESDEILTLRAFKKNSIANPVVVARDGQEALDYLMGSGVHAGRDPALEPLLVLLDLGLPRIGGLEVLRRIRSQERTRLLPVVVLTSSKEDEDIVKSYSLGANGYVRKPVELEGLNEAVRGLGVYWLQINQPAPAAKG